MLTAALSWCILVKCPGGEMVDTADLKSAVFGHAGSSPAPGTTPYLLIGMLESTKRVCHSCS